MTELMTCLTDLRIAGLSLLNGEEHFSLSSPRSYPWSYWYIKTNVNEIRHTVQTINLIAGTHSIRYAWNAFYEFHIFKQCYIMIKMRWYDVQTRKYIVRTIMYPIICTHHVLQGKNRIKHIASPGSIWSNRRIMTIQSPQSHNYRNMTTVDKVVTSELIMIIRSDTDLSSWSY